MLQPVMRIERATFGTKEDIYRDLLATGYWPTLYFSNPSPELPLHWHDGDTIGYVIEGTTYVLNEKGERCDLGPGDKLVIPAGALHAEGEVTDPVTYLVTTQRCEPFFQAFRMLDPAKYPDPQMLELDPALMKALMGQGGL